MMMSGDEEEGDVGGEVCFNSGKINGEVEIMGEEYI